MNIIIRAYMKITQTIYELLHHKKAKCINKEKDIWEYRCEGCNNTVQAHRSGFKKWLETGQHFHCPVCQTKTYI